MAERLKYPEAGMSRPLKEALAAVERMGRAAARRNAALKSNKPPRDAPDGSDGDHGDDGDDGSEDQAQRRAVPFLWPPAGPTA